MNLTDLKKAFEDAGISVIEACRVNRNIHSHLKPYFGQKDIIVAAYGGDGTLSRVAGALAGTQTIFAPLPGGTLNHFTKDLGIPQDLEEALQKLKKSKPKRIDLACVNDRVIVNNSSIGLYPSALQMRDEMTRKHIAKWPAAVIAHFKAFWRYYPYVVTINGETFRTPFIFVGNNDYALEQRLIGRRKRLNEGVLSVYAIVCAGRLALLRILIRALFGQVGSLDEIKIWKPKQLAIHTKRSRIRISRDGEHETISTPLEYKIMAGALLVIGSS